MEPITNQQPSCNYNASLKTKVAVVAGTALTSGLCIAQMMKSKKLKKLPQLEMGIKEGVLLCTSSTLGGLGAGLLVDEPQHKKAKLKDGINQLIGNTLVPFGCLAVMNKGTKKLPKPIQTVLAISTLIGTTFLGHFVANKVNKKVFNEESGYKCDIKDFATDFDDIFFAASTVLNSKKLYQFTASICPFTYMVHGILAGTRQENKKLDKYI